MLASVGKILELKYGKALKQEDRKGGKYPVFGSSGVVGYHDEALVYKPTLIVGRKGSIGEVYYTQEPCWVIDTAYYVEYDPAQLSLLWLKEALISLNLKKLNQAAAVPGLNRNDVYKLKLEIPALDDQIRIATVLSKAEALIVQRKESIRLLDEFLRSTFLKMFGDPMRNTKRWNVKKLSQLVKVGTGGTPSRQKESEYYNGEIPWAKTTEVNGTYIFETEEKITELAVDDSNCKIYPVDTILLAMYGQGKTRGNVGMLKIPAATNQACAAIPPSSEINQTFLFELLKNSYQFIRSLARGGNQENLNLRIVGDIGIIQPPLAIQNQFEDIIKKVDALKSLYQASLRKLETLFNSLSQRAFKGELKLISFEVVVPDPKTLVEKPVEKPVKIVKGKRPKILREYGDPLEGKAIPEDRLMALTEAKKLLGDRYEEIIDKSFPSREDESVWLRSRAFKGDKRIPFNEVEGRAVLDKEFAKRSYGFTSNEFVGFLQSQKFDFNTDSIARFFMLALDSKKLVQRYSKNTEVEVNRSDAAKQENIIWFAHNVVAK
jgi:type I restriction enzyme S subunit